MPTHENIFAKEYSKNREPYPGIIHHVMSAAEPNLHKPEGYWAPDYSPPVFLEEHLGKPLQEIVVALVRMGADTSIVHPRLGMAPLHLACLRGWTSTAIYFLSEGEVDAKGLGGQTALHVAARANQSGAIKELLVSRADLNAKDDLGETALDKATRWGCDEAAAVLMKNAK